MKLTPGCRGSGPGGAAGEQLASSLKAEGAARSLPGLRQGPRVSLWTLSAAFWGFFFFLPRGKAALLYLGAAAGAFRSVRARLCLLQPPEK